jgi:hypothetical protein
MSAIIAAILAAHIAQSAPPYVPPLATCYTVGACTTCQVVSGLTCTVCTR